MTTPANELGFPPDLQAIILACRDGARLYPLNEGCPMALLPVLNRPILQYQLDALAAATFTEALVVAAEDGTAQVSKFLDQYSGPIKVDLVSVDSSLDTADVLRQVRDKIRSDFLLIPGDLVCEEVIRQLARVHGLNRPDLTMLLREETVEPDIKGKKSTRAKRDDEDIDFVGLTPEGRLVIKTPSLFADDVVAVQKALLRRHTTVSVSTNLIDVNVYIFSFGVLRFLETHRHMQSVQNELVPALVRRQFQGPAQERPLMTRRSIIGPSAPGMKAATTGATDDDDMLVAKLSSGGPLDGSAPDECPQDLLSCFAVALRGDKPGTYCCQTKTLAQYVAVNRDLMSRNFGENVPWGRLEGFKKKDQICVGPDCTIAEKVNCKLSVLGKSCKIGARSKINNCILMENVTIGENCTIQNSIICPNATIEEGCNLNDCQVGYLTRVAAGTRAKQETFTRKI